MRQLGFLLVVVCLVITSVWAQQVPEAPPQSWNVSIRVYGTTDIPNRNSSLIFIHTNGTHPVTIGATRPRYDDGGKINRDSPKHQGNLDDASAATIYAAVRSTIQNHLIGTEPLEHIADGTSVEVSINSYDRQIAATFMHSGHERSKEYRQLALAINEHLPEQFQLK